MKLSNIYTSQFIRRIFISGTIGNILETYDLILITLLSTTLSKTFFPPIYDSHASTVNILYVFLMGLLVRPLGNIILGISADQLGRKKIMIISLLCTGFGTISIGLLPAYSTIGIWSTILFIFFVYFKIFLRGSSILIQQLI